MTFPISPLSKAWRARHYPDTTDSQWSDWRWQTRMALSTGSELATYFSSTVPMRLPPYMAAMADNCPALARAYVPDTTEEAIMVEGESTDALGEATHSPVPGLIHRYPDRVVLLATGFCPGHCRYCNRPIRGVEHPCPGSRIAALDYIRDHSEIRDVLISGGDPLSLPDATLDSLLGEIRAIDHVEFLRIGTKIPAMLPMRVTTGLIRVLRRHKPWLSLHFIHPNELAEETAFACNRLADAGLPLGGHTPLLKTVNDSAETLKTLFHGMLRLRVRPYYLFHCDQVAGASRFRTPVQTGIDMIESLRGHTSGYAVPTYAVDPPDGTGKIALAPKTMLGRDDNDLLLVNYEGRTIRYHDPVTL
ncbi:MAG: KamA family radical SAM protein [Pseudomonadota bacterium]|nr:KamA family radical SAM protein [Pseudomonadota bacterium]